MRARIFLAGLVLLLGFASISNAIEDATVTGHVISTDDYTGISGATVTISKNGMDLFQETTDQSGTYTFSTVPAGSYIIGASKEGYLQIQPNPRPLTVASTTIQVNFPMQPFRTGDIDGDGQVLHADIYEVLRHWSNRRTDPQSFNPAADLIDDRVINFKDLFEAAKRWDRPISPVWEKYTATPTSAATNTPVNTATSVFTDTPTETPTQTPTDTIPTQATSTFTPTMTSTSTSTPTLTPTFTMTWTATATDTPTETNFAAPKLNLEPYLTF